MWFVGGLGYRPGVAEKVELGTLDGALRVRAWAQEAPASWRYREVAIGTAGGRWFAVRVGQRWSGAWLCRDERDACETAERFMASGEWRETPAQYGGDGKPLEPGWVKRGGDWWRE